MPLLGPTIRAGVRAGVFVLALAATPLVAQEPPGQPRGTAPGAAKPQAAPAAAGKSAADAQAKPAAGGDGGLRQRVEQLEEQLVDLQVVVGTLESLSRSGGGAAAPASAFRPTEPSGGGGADGARLDGLETQIRALTAELEQLATEVRASRGERRDTFAPSAAPGAGSPSAGTVGSFGSTTVTSDSGDPIGGLISEGGSAGAPTGLPPQGTPSAGLPPPQPPGQVAALPPVDASPKLLYETAYGNLLRQDYTSAQAGFEDFMRKHPRDSLAPDALYWLGETHYVQRNYSDAAEAFDLVSSAYGASAKAPEALLKRGLALHQLGKKDEACTALRQISAKYPNARPVVKQRADSERQRAGCG